MEAPLVSIIVPVYAELDSLNQTVDLLVTGFAGLPMEIIIVAHPDSGSACLENGRKLAEDITCVNFQIQKQLPGQGFAFRQAIESSKGNFILLMNADLETDPRDARLLYDSICQHNFDLVVASRWCKGAHFDAASYGRGKIILNFLFQRLFALIFNTPITDLSFCYKIARAEIFKKPQWKGTQHEFALETTLIPIVLGMRVKEIPTRWQGRREGTSHFNFWRSLRHVQLALNIIWYKINGTLAEIYDAKDAGSK